MSDGHTDIWKPKTHAMKMADKDAELTTLRARVAELEREHNQIRNEVLRWVADKLGCACPTYHNIEQQITRLTNERDEAIRERDAERRAFHADLQRSMTAQRWTPLSREDAAILKIGEDNWIVPKQIADHVQALTRHASKGGDANEPSRNSNDGCSPA